MLPTLRVNRIRFPLAAISKISLAALPIEEHGVDSILALDDIAAVSGVPLEDVVACAERSACHCPDCRR